MGFDQADSKLSKIVDNSDFGYWEVPIMHPLYDENGKIVVETKGKNKGKPKADKDLTDKNRVQFSYAGGVEAFYSEEVKPYSPDAWIDWDNIKIGYDISFTKYFYDPEDLRDALDIVSDLNNIHSESTQTLEKIIEHAKGKVCRADWNCLEKFRTTRPLESGCLIVPLIQHIKRTIIRQVYNTH